MISESAETTPPLGLCIGSDWNDDRERNPPPILSSSLSNPLPGNGQHSSRASGPRVEEEEKIASPRSNTPSRYVVTPRGGLHDTHSTGDDAVDKVSILFLFYEHALTLDRYTRLMSELCLPCSYLRLRGFSRREGAEQAKCWQPVTTTSP